MSQREFDFTEHGVRPRYDGKGDGWADAHRRHLGLPFYMQDIDGVFGQTIFAANTADALFIEYEPDSIANRLRLVRQFGLIAFFDRKWSREAAIENSNPVQIAFYLWLCRMFDWQPIKPRFFFVIGTEVPPWLMIELNTQSGEPVREVLLSAGSLWSDIWEAIGLAPGRRKLREWLHAERTHLETQNTHATRP